MISLNRKNLSEIAASGIEVPTYPLKYQHRICHIGVGGFHRAHQAYYLHKLLQEQKGEGWGICGIGLMPADKAMHDLLHKQDFLYSLWAMGTKNKTVSIVGSIMDHIDAYNDKQKALDSLADEATKIVSLTITEKGYCLQKNGELDLTNPLIAGDLKNFDNPTSAIGFVTKALALRKEKNIKPFTVMSCDNLVENGHQAKKAILDFAKHIDSELAKWIGSCVTFPLSMVDRITPAPQKTRIENLCRDWGVQDEGLLVCEDWLQWVLEDSFCNGRPPLELAGVQMTADVKPYEDMKVGLLNGSHSALSYYGLLKGYVRVDEAIRDVNIQQWLRAYMIQVAGTLAPVQGIDVSKYQDALIERYSNTNIEDRLLRLAEDGSAKFQQTLLPALKKLLNTNGDFRFLASAIANWIVYLEGLSQNEAAAAQYRDPMKDQLIALAVQSINREDAKPFIKAVFGLSDKDTDTFSAQVQDYVRGILKKE